MQHFTAYKQKPRGKITAVVYSVYLSYNIILMKCNIFFPHLVRFLRILCVIR